MFTKFLKILKRKILAQSTGKSSIQDEQIDLIEEIQHHRNLLQPIKDNSKEKTKLQNASREISSSKLEGSEPYKSSEVNNSTDSVYQILYDNFCLQILGLESDISVSKIIKETHTYEPWLVKYLLILSQDEQIAIDIGANIGIISIILSNATDRNKVIAVEPHPEVFKVLEKNTFNIENIAILNLAIGDANRSAIIESEVKNRGLDYGGSSIICSSSWKSKSSSNSKKYAVEQVSLESLIHVFNIDKLDILKIDIEGYEFNVVEGSLQIIRKLKPILFLEFFPDKLRVYGKNNDFHLFELLIDIYDAIFLINRSTLKLIKIQSYAELRSLMMTGHGVEDLLCVTNKNLEILRNYIDNSLKVFTYGASYLEKVCDVKIFHFGHYPDGWNHEHQTAIIIDCSTVSALNSNIKLCFYESVEGQLVRVSCGKEFLEIDLTRGLNNVSIELPVSNIFETVHIEASKTLDAHKYFQNSDPRKISFRFSLQLQSIT